VLQDGIIVEDGAPDILAQGVGPFGRMWRLQKRGVTKPAPAQAGAARWEAMRNTTGVEASCEHSVAEDVDGARRRRRAGH
jgi:hypothetical protein